MAGRGLSEHLKFADRFPVVNCFAGQPVLLAEADMVTTEDFIADGYDLGMVAIELGLCELDFKQSCKVNLRLQAAIKRGRSRAKHEYMQALKSSALTGKAPALTIWYGKQAFNMQDKQAVSHSGGGVIVVNTGIPAPEITSNSPNVIEHNDG